MGILEEIQRMQQSGLSEEEIISKLQEQGNPYRDISEAMAQSKIKQAVEDRSSIPEPPTPSDSQTQGMQQSIIQISEQIVSEKMTDIRKKMEKISIFKTELETKTESIEERLKRIEKIIDTLQTSVLRKVGDYVTNVEDLKHEMIETQKTFAKVLGSKHHEKEHKK